MEETPIDKDFIIRQYQSGVESYSDFTTEVGLWDSEKVVFQTHLMPEDSILDLGCGTGRTTFPLHKLGYQHIIGLDLTPEMIEEANLLNQQFGTEIPFQVGDATALPFPDNHFEKVIFSFNGLMSIPKSSNRKKAIQEIHRVLKPSGKFIFTTHDREKDLKFVDYWDTERDRWNQNKQDPRLFEFGDRITQSRNEERMIFIHIPSKDEVSTLLQENGFKVIDTFYRADRFNEPEAVKIKSGECRFWVVSYL